MKALSSAEMQKLLDSIEDERLRLMVRLAGFHAMRASEVCKLKRADIDLDAGTILIRRLKGSKTTLQPLGAIEKTELTLEIDKHPKSLWVFPNASGYPISRKTFWKHFKAACLSIGIPKDKAHCHVLKHTALTTLIRNGMELAHVQAYAGHSAIGSTLQYLSVDEDEVFRQAELAFKKAEEKCKTNLTS